MPEALVRHPRLLFISEELPSLRQFASRGLRGRILRRLEQACDCFLTPGHPHYLDFRERRKDIWRQRSGIFTVLPTLSALATGYAFTGNAAYADFARDAVAEIMKEGLADVKSSAYGSPNEGWRHGPGHDKGKFALCLAWVYDTCFDRFSPELRSRFAEYARESIKLAEEHRTFDTAQVANNRGIAGLMVPFLFGLTLEGEADLGDMNALLTNAVVNLEKYLFLSFDADGAPFEGPGYAGRIAFAALMAEMVRRRGGPNLLTHNRFERFPAYLLYELLPGGGSTNNLNDTHIPCGSVAGSLHLMGTERGLLLPWLARQLDLHPSRLIPWLEADDWDPGAFDIYQVLPFLLHWDDDAPVRSPEELGYPASRWFRGRGVVSMRSGWGNNDFLLTHFCGRQELYCHRQGDYNHLSLYALGESFLVDAGYGHPFGDLSKPVNRWFGLTSAHNCVLVDRLEQRGVVESPGWAEGEILEFAQDRGFDTSLGDASSCTGPDHRVRRSLRRVVFVKECPTPFLAVLDVNEKDGQEFLAECLWTTDPRNRLELTANGFVIHGKENRCEAAVLWPERPEISLANSMGRPQVRLAVKAPVAEVVTVFCPCQKHTPAPAFSCQREGEGRFWVNWQSEGRRFRLYLTACLFPLLRKLVPVSLEIDCFARSPLDR